MKAIKKILTTIIIVFYSVIIILITITMILGFTPTKINDTDKYLKTDGSVSRFEIFPKSLDSVDNIIDYHYYDYHLKDGHVVYLEAEYSEENFEKELLRLESKTYETPVFEAFDGSDLLPAKKDESVLFNYTTYVIKYNLSVEYEYACVDYDNRRIAYVYFEDITVERMGIDEKYLPKNYYVKIHKKNYFQSYAEYSNDPYVFTIHSSSRDKINWYE